MELSQYDTMHPERAGTTKEANKLKHVASVRSDSIKSLTELQEDAEQLISELQVIHAELHKLQTEIHLIVNKSNNMVHNWNGKTPVLASVAVGGVDKTFHFLGGRNAARMNKIVQFHTSQQTTEGQHIRNFLNRLSATAIASIQEAEVPRNIPENDRIKSLVTQVLYLSHTGYRDSTHCVMITGHAHTEVAVFFTHLLAWIQIKILESYTELKEHIPYNLMTSKKLNHSGNSISSIWRQFNDKLEKAPVQQVRTVRNCMRDFLCRAMPVKVKPISKTVDLRQCALTHLQSRAGCLINLQDTFMESVQSRYQKDASAQNDLILGKKERSSDTAEKTKVQRAKGHSWPADITVKATRAACVALSFVLARLTTTVLKTSDDDNMTDLETYLESFDSSTHVDWLTSILEDDKVSVLNKLEIVQCLLT